MSRWKVRRVWDVEDVDDEEDEHSVDHQDLMNTIKNLLGVPEELGNSTKEWNVQIDESSSWYVQANDSPPFYVKKLYDIDGELDESEEECNFGDFDILQEIKGITEEADHRFKELYYDCTYQGGPKERAFTQPDDWVLPMEKTNREPTWKSKRDWSVNEGESQLDSIPPPDEKDGEEERAAEPEVDTEAESSIDGSQRRYSVRAFARPNGWISPLEQEKPQPREWKVKKKWSDDGED
jgi:hypothetical protein